MDMDAEGLAVPLKNQTAPNRRRTQKMFFPTLPGSFMELILKRTGLLVNKKIKLCWKRTIFRFLSRFGQWSIHSFLDVDGLNIPLHYPAQQESL